MRTKTYGVFVKRDEIPHAKLREVLNYDPDTGKFERASGTRPQEQGVKVGARVDTGYDHVQIFGHTYKAHRLAWFWVFGEWPREQIDHINRDRSDNRLGNLRDVSRRVNLANRNPSTKVACSAPKKYCRGKHCVLPKPHLQHGMKRGRYPAQYRQEDAASGGL